MDYTFIEQPENHSGHWLPHNVDLWISPNNEMKLLLFLKESFGEVEKDWIFHTTWNQELINLPLIPSEQARKMTVQFARMEQVTYFKMSWEEEQDPSIEWKNLVEWFNKMSANFKNTAVSSPIPFQTIKEFTGSIEPTISVMKCRQVDQSEKKNVFMNFNKMKFGEDSDEDHNDET